MNRIHMIKAVRENDVNQFNKELEQVVDKMQKELLDVEIQYSTALKLKSNGIIDYSALVIGRK